MTEKVADFVPIPPMENPINTDLNKFPKTFVQGKLKRIIRK